MAMGPPDNLHEVCATAPRSHVISRLIDTQIVRPQGSAHSFEYECVMPEIREPCG